MKTTSSNRKHNMNNTSNTLDDKFLKLNTLKLNEGRDDILKLLDLDIDWDTYVKDGKNILDNIKKVVLSSEL